MSKMERLRTVDVSSQQLALLVQTLRFSADFFTSRPSPPLSDHDLLFKAPKSTLKREISWLREFMRLTSELLDWLDERRRLPPVKVRLRSHESADIADAARDLRENLGLAATTPIDYLTHPVERAGIVVIVRRRGLADSEWISQSEQSHTEYHEGCSTWVGEFRERPLVVMRGVNTWEKTRWVLAHELGHLSLHAGRTLVSDEAEEHASRFASELLAPICEIVKELPRVVTLAGLIDVKSKWGISLAALIKHLHSNDVINDYRKKTLYDQLYTRRNPETGRSFGVTEPGWDAHAPERPRLIAAWLKHITGSLIPEAIATASGIFPADLLASILNEQRAAPSRSVSSANSNRGRNSGGVIHLSERYPGRTSDPKHSLLNYLS
jgi:Zn-dependent peptidase ImmA (M78 family)